MRAKMMHKYSSLANELGFEILELLEDEIQGFDLAFGNMDDPDLIEDKLIDLIESFLKKNCHITGDIKF